MITELYAVDLAKSIEVETIWTQFAHRNEADQQVGRLLGCTDTCARASINYNSQEQTKSFKI